MYADNVPQEDTQCKWINEDNSTCDRESWQILDEKLKFVMTFFDFCPVVEKWQIGKIKLQNLIQILQKSDVIKKEEKKWNEEKQCQILCIIFPDLPLHIRSTPRDAFCLNCTR